MAHGKSRTAGNGKSRTAGSGKSRTAGNWKSRTARNGKSRTAGNGNQGQPGTGNQGQRGTGKWRRQPILTPFSAPEGAQGSHFMPRGTPYDQDGKKDLTQHRSHFLEIGIPAQDLESGHRPARLATEPSDWPQSPQDWPWSPQDCPRSPQDCPQSPQDWGSGLTSGVWTDIECLD